MDTNGRLKLKTERLLKRVNEEFERNFRTPKQMMRTLYKECGDSFEKVGEKIGIARDTAYKYAKFLKLKRGRKYDARMKREILILNQNGANRGDIPKYIGCSQVYVDSVLKDKETNERKTCKQLFNDLPEEDKRKPNEELAFILNCSPGYVWKLKNVYNRRKEKEELRNHRNRRIHSSKAFKGNKSRKRKLNSLTRSS